MNKNREMQEVDDDMTIAVAKIMKDMVGDVYNEHIPNSMSEKYQYLLLNTLISPFNKEELRSYVYSAYTQLAGDIEEEDDGYIRYPSISEILTLIDEENLFIIQHFYQEYDFEDDEIEMVKAKYVSEVSAVMYDSVKTVLNERGLPFSSTSVFSSTDMRLVSGEINQYQQILIYDFFY